MSFFTRPDSPPPPIPSPPIVPISLPSPPCRTRRTLHPSRSYDRLRPDNNSSALKRSPRRPLSVAVPYLSPPPSPSIASPPPPVPTIPAFVLTPTDKKPVLRSDRAQPRWPPPIRVPELNISPPSPFSSSPPKNNRSPSATTSREDSPMTCSKFLSMRNSTQKAAARTAAV